MKSSTQPRQKTISPIWQWVKPWNLLLYLEHPRTDFLALPVSNMPNIPAMWLWPLLVCSTQWILSLVTTTSEVFLVVRESVLVLLRFVLTGVPFNAGTTVPGVLMLPLLSSLLKTWRIRVRFPTPPSLCLFTKLLRMLTICLTRSQFFTRVAKFILALPTKLSSFSKTWATTALSARQPVTF